MKILLLEPFYTGSHKSWADGLKANSTHQVHIMSMSGHHWKWRMHGGAVTLARQFNESSLQPDLILATDMIDLNIFLSLTRKRTAGVPVLLYFHENQLTYPWSPKDRDKALKRDNHYSFINYASALAADQLLFNSEYHLQSFFEELPAFLRAFPDHNETGSIDKLKAKASVLPLGLDLSGLQALKPETIERPNRAVLLWNHRWEFDKDPDTFFKSLLQLNEHGIDFRLIVLGESFDNSPAIFDEALKILSDKVLHVGYVESKAEYAHWLHLADILPVTSRHDFFGASVVQAMACNVIPLLPNRLAYPEHIPAQFAQTFFYEDDVEFVKKLQRRIMDVRVLRSQKTAHFVAHYDWKLIIKKYDSLFEAAVFV